MSAMSIKVFNQKFTLGELWKLKSALSRPILHPSKYFNFIENYLSRISGLCSVWGLPPFLMIEPTSRCDMSCPVCFVRDRGIYPSGDMDLESYEKILCEIGYALVTLALWGYGEPLLNKNLPEMILLARDYGVLTSVSTNALSLDEGFAERLIDSGLNYLIISLDGASEETYSLYRSHGKFENVVKNIERLTRIKKAKRSAHPFVNLQFIVMKGNEHEIAKIKKLALDLGVDKLSLKKVWVFTKDEEKKLLPLDKRYHLKIYSDPLDTGICARPWSTPFITWRGDVLVCCADFGYSHIMGNIFKERGFLKVWNNGKFKSFRMAAVRDISRIDICRRCAAKNFDDGFINET